MKLDEESLIKCLLKLQKNINKENHDIISEFDDEALFKTSLSYKKIEFLGFDKIWDMIRNTKKIHNLALDYIQIADMYQNGSVGVLFQSLTELSLESSLINSWDFLNMLAKEFHNLEYLHMNNNVLFLNEELNEMRINFNETFDLGK